jgi:hypothetical protein
MKTRLAALALAAVALACADNSASIEPYAICAPPDDECVFSSECDLQYIGRLALDTSVSQQLWIFLQVNNQLPVNGDLSAGRVNTNDAYVMEYEVEYEGAASGSSMGRLQSIVPASGSAVISVFLQPPPTAAGEVIAKLRLKGEYVDQSDFETAEFEIPITVCQGCLGLPGCPVGEVITSICPPTAGQTALAVTCEAADTTTTPPVP